MPLPHSIPDELIALIARRFHKLGEPMRRGLLDRLRDDLTADDDVVGLCAQTCGSLEHQFRELAAHVGDFADRPPALTPQRME